MDAVHIVHRGRCTVHAQASFIEPRRGTRATQRSRGRGIYGANAVLTRTWGTAPTADAPPASRTGNNGTTTLTVSFAGTATSSVGQRNAPASPSRAEQFSRSTRELLHVASQPTLADDGAEGFDAHSTADGTGLGAEPPDPHSRRVVAFPRVRMPTGYASGGSVAGLAFQPPSHAGSGTCAASRCFLLLPSHIIARSRVRYSPVRGPDVVRTAQGTTTQIACRYAHL